MRFMENKKLATRIGIATTVITLVGMTLLWLAVSINAASVVKNDITNQMTDAVESRAAIIDTYVLSAEADQSGHYEVPWHRQHDPVYARPDL